MTEDAIDEIVHRDEIRHALAQTADTTFVCLARTQWPADRAALKAARERIKTTACPTCEELAKALKKFGTHERTCGYMGQGGPPNEHDGSREDFCTCGLDTAIAAYKAGKETT